MCVSSLKTRLNGRDQSWNLVSLTTRQWSANAVSYRVGNFRHDMKFMWRLRSFYPSVQPSFVDTYARSSRTFTQEVELTGNASVRRLPKRQAIFDYFACAVGPSSAPSLAMAGCGVLSFVGTSLDTLPLQTRFQVWWEVTVQSLQCYPETCESLLRN